MNTVTLVGRLSRDVDQRTISEDKRVAKFTIVTEERVKKNGEWQNVSTFHEIDAWNSRAKFLENFKKGDVIEVIGSIFNDNYEDKDGKKVYKNRIRANGLSFVPRAYKNDTETVAVASGEAAESNAPF